MSEILEQWAMKENFLKSSKDFTKHFYKDWHQNSQWKHVGHKKTEEIYLQIFEIKMITNLEFYILSYYSSVSVK